jgi:uncharacterized tellurite resistance protein B-like protein
MRHASASNRRNRSRNGAPARPAGAAGNGQSARGAGDAAPYCRPIVHMMIMVSAADRELHGLELRHIRAIVGTLPLFRFYRSANLARDAADAARRLAAGGEDAVIGELAALLPAHLRETAYALACEVAVADRRFPAEENQLLRRLRQGLKIHRLIASALERAAAARSAS